MKIEIPRNRIDINNNVKELFKNSDDIKRVVLELSSFSFNNAIKNNEILKLLSPSTISAAARDYWLLGETFIARKKDGFMILNPNNVRVQIVKTDRQDKKGKDIHERIFFYGDEQIKINCIYVANFSCIYDLRGTSIVNHNGTIRDIEKDSFTEELLSEVLKWKRI